MTFTAPDGEFAVRLASARWKVGRGPDRTALYLERHVGATQVSIRIGDAEGRVRMCDRPVRTWPPEAVPERCEVMVATSLEALVDATLRGSDPDPRVLDGEPAVSVGWQGYEYPARGGQALSYLLAMRDARPLVMRFWSSTTGLSGVDEILAGFRFVD